MPRIAVCACLGFLLAASSAIAGDWVGYRGLSAGGASDDKGLPTTWNPTEHVVWKTELPGAGTSSPITIGDKVLVTCYRGAERDGSGSLERILVCADRASGKTLWMRQVSAKAAENRDAANGMLMSHGFASSTPVTDGTNVYVLFGKSGVLAFDLEGKQLWHTDVGNGDALMGWGSASSPVLYKNLVIVNAGAEAQAVIALDKTTGKEVWKAPAEGLEGCWATPILVDIGDGQQDLVLNAPYEIWGFNPDTGKVRWYCEGVQGGTVCPSIVAKDGIVYAIGGGGGGTQPGAVAVKAGGKGDVNETHVVWRQRVGSYVTSPVIVGEHLYWVNNQNQAICLKLADGETVFQERLFGGTGGGGRSKAGESRPPAGGGRGGGFGSQPYASVVAADGKLFAFMRQGEAVVLAAAPKFEILAKNKLDNDAGQFNATPAIDDGQLLVRSDKYLYCLGTK
jgi:hypothetical protein